jgi:hypothetical protein
MARTVAIGIQSFETVIERNCFYVDKTAFIKEWWEKGDAVTLIARPRRFGKTLNMSMMERFFSNKYAGQGQIFEGLDVWKDSVYRELQGTYPVISLSFANVKETNLADAKTILKGVLAKQYYERRFLLEGDLLGQQEKEYFSRVSEGMSDTDATQSLHNLMDYLSRYYGKKVPVFLDEYDTPMQEAYVNGYWDALVAFIRSLFNATFKTNDYLERAIMTGITRVSTPQASLGKESIFRI